MMEPTAVILAAGRGSRLLERTDIQPKCLVSLGGQPLIHYALTSLAEAGVRHALVVAGYRQNQVALALGNSGAFGLTVEIVSNPQYPLGNATSLARALAALRSEWFILTMADHVVSPDLFRALSAAEGMNAIAVDRSAVHPERLDDATKVLTQQDLVRSLGKDLIAWDAIDTGVSCWRKSTFLSTGSSGPTGELAAVMSHVASAHAVRAVDVTGTFWMDIDTPDDLVEAEMVLGADARLLA